MTEKRDLPVMNEYEVDLRDQVAKELYVRRVYGMNGLKDYELEQIAVDAYHKAQILIKVRPQR